MRGQNWVSREWKTILFWMAVVWLFFGYSLFFDFFIFDDAIHITRNKFTAVEKWSYLGHFWQNSLTPVIFFIWQLISLAFGHEDPWPFRLFNLVLFGGCAFLLFRIFQDFVENFKGRGEKYYSYLPYISVLFYLLHPAQIESVIWVSSGRTLLATFFALLSTYFYLLYQKNRVQKLYAVFVVVFFTLGMLSKPSIVTLPILLLAIGFLQGRTLSELGHLLWPIFGVGLIFSVFHLLDVESTYLGNLAIKSRLIVLLDSVFHYFKMLIFPFGVLFDYGRNPERVMSEFVQLGGSFFIVPLSILTFICLGFLIRKFRTISFFLTLFYILLSPNLGIFQYDFQNISTVANRYLNFPLVAISMGLLFWGKDILDSLYRWKSEKLFCLALVPLLLFFISGIQNGKRWQSPELVLKGGGSLDRETFSVAMSLGYFFEQRGRFKAAESYFYRARRLDPTSIGPIVGLLNVYLQYRNINKIEMLLKHIKEQNILLPANYTPHLADLYFTTGDYPNAIKMSKIANDNGIEREHASKIYQDSIEKIASAKIEHYLELIEILVIEKKNTRARAITIEALKEFPEHREFLIQKKALEATMREPLK